MKIKDLIKIGKVQELIFKPIDMTNTKIGGGVYRMYDTTGEIVYVGKSQDLHKRMLKHLGKDTNTAYFIDDIKFIEWHLEPDPVFQTMLEGIFIAYHRPKYNDEVKDSKKKFGEDNDKARK
jgi:DNA polymerase III subunit epsilon